MFNFFKFNSQNFNSRDKQTNFEKEGNLEFTFLIESNVSYTPPPKKKKKGGGDKQFFQQFSLEFNIVGKRTQKVEYDFTFIGTRTLQETYFFDIFGKILEVELQDLSLSGVKLEESKEVSLLKGNRLYDYLEERNISGQRILGKAETSGVFKGIKTLSLSDLNMLVGKKLNQDHMNAGIRGYKTEKINSTLHLLGKQDNTTLFEALALIEE